MEHTSIEYNPYFIKTNAFLPMHREVDYISDRIVVIPGDKILKQRAFSQ